MMILGCATKKLYLETFEEVWTTVDETYPYEDFGGVDWDEQHEIYEKKVKKAKDDDALHLYLQSMLETLGVSHVSIFPKELYTENDDDKEIEEENDESEEKENSEQSKKQKGWTGIELRWIEEKLIVTKIHPDTVFPDNSTIELGSRITHINGTNIFSYSRRFESDRERAFSVGRYGISKLEGNLGDEVTLTIQDGEESVDEVFGFQELNSMTSTGTFNLPASTVHFDYSKLENDIHYLSFNVFLIPIREKIQAAFEQIVEANPKGLIIDLRGNPGGFVDLGVYISSFLVSEKDLDLGKQISRDGTLYLTIYPRPASQLYTGKVVILIDELSASTSEVVAGGLQELGRVTVIGQRSAGKALPSMIKTLANGDRFQFVVADLLKPSGERFEESGVVPDIVVDRKIEDYRGKIDPEIQSALEFFDQNTEKKQEPSEGSLE